MFDFISEIKLVQLQQLNLQHIITHFMEISNVTRQLIICVLKERTSYSKSNKILI